VEWSWWWFILSLVLTAGEGTYISRSRAGRTVNELEEKVDELEDELSETRDVNDNRHYDEGYD